MFEVYGIDGSEHDLFQDRQPELWAWLKENQARWGQANLQARWGDYLKWCSILDELPRLDCQFDTRRGVVIKGQAEASEKIRDLYMRLNPWRKGPFDVFTIKIDSEWRSNLKWDRLSKGLKSIEGKTVLDIGAGNGYYGFRLAALKPRVVVCVEPVGLYWAQYRAIRRYIKGIPMAFIPDSFEQLSDIGSYDVVLSLGVIYHCRDHLAHILRLKQHLCVGGQLLIESLVMPQQYGGLSLTGKQRYAQMHNVWHIPTVSELKQWLIDCGFSRVKLIDCTLTTSVEQRQTDWMKFHSLTNYLMPDQPDLTVEGYPAPCRALLSAELLAKS